MQCFFNFFKTEIIEFLKSRIPHTADNITNIAAFNRIDLLEIIYKETNVFLTHGVVLNEAAAKGSLEIVKFLTELGASCTSNAMDYASLFGSLEVVKYLHLNRSEGCVQALQFASQKGHFEVVKYLVENALGLDYIHRALNLVKRKGNSEIAKYLQDHITD